MLERQNKEIYLFGSIEPGCGLTTAATTFANEHELEYVEAGKYRRAITQHWLAFQAEHGDSESTWKKFVECYEAAVENSDLSTLYQLVQPFLGQNRNGGENNLKKFNKRAKEITLFDKIPELLVLHQLQQGTEKEGFVVAGKLAPILDILVNSELPGQIVLRLLLSIDDEEGAKRVINREIDLENLVPPNPNKLRGAAHRLWMRWQIRRITRLNRKRMDGDWKRYPQVFSGPDNQPLRRSHLTEHPDVKQLDTTDLDQKGVVEAINQLLLGQT